MRRHGRCNCRAGQSGSAAAAHCGAGAQLGVDAPDDALPGPIDVMAEVPDGPPLLFTWRRVRRRVMRATGPERIEPEWWAGGGTGGRDDAVRDYYRIEDADGRRYRLYRAGLYGDAGTGASPRWYVHGLYG